MKVIETESEFKNLKSKWNKLVDNIFLTWEWLYSWWEIYKKDNWKLHILVINDEEEIIGISPTYVEHKFGYKVVRFLGDGHVSSNYLDFIGQNVDDFVNYFLKNHLLNLRYVENNSKNKLSNFTFSQIELSKCPVIKLSRDYLDNISPKTRKNLRLSEMRIFRDFNASIEIDTTIKRKNLEKIKIISTRRWNSTSSMNSEKYYLFLQKVAERFAKNSWIELLLLNVGNETVAYKINFLYRNVFSVYSSAHDPLFNSDSKYSFGTCLHYINLKRAVFLGYGHYDFLRGALAYKKKLANDEKINYGIMIYSNSPLHLSYVAPIIILNKLSYFVENKIPYKYKNALLKIIPKSLTQKIR